MLVSIFHKEACMKVLIIVTAMLALVAGATVAADQTWTGTISDKMCGANHQAMGEKMVDRECTQACAQGGAPYVLISDGQVYQLTNHDGDSRTHAGHTVNLTGNLKGDTIRVSKIEMPTTSK
jgi:hypothetical protein